MSANDRCREASLILQNGGVIPEEVRAALIEMLDDGADGLGTHTARLIALPIRDANPDLFKKISDGEIPGLYEEGTTP